jgi:hypothetical protein
MGRVALEIDWNVVDPGHGCGCYEPDAKRITARDKKPDFCFDKTPFEGVAGCEPEEKKPPRVFISPVAVKWLAGNRQALKAAGWTMRELYRRNRSKGLAWVSLWDQPGLSVALESGGVISFHFLTTTGQKIRQTAYPRKHQQKRSISHELRCKRMQIHRQG